MPDPRDIRSLFLVLTARCNLTCGYCYQNDKNPRRMDWPTARRALDWVLRSRRREVDLVFFGGEPLLEFDIIRRAVAHVEPRKPRRLSVNYAIITNGVLLKDEALEFLAEHAFEVQLSFDGVAAAQNLRGRGTFPVLDRVLLRMRKEFPELFGRLSISVTVLPATISHMADSFAYFLKRGVRSVAFSPTFTNSSDWRDEQLEELNRQFERIYKKSRAHHRRTGKTPFQGFAGKGESPHLPRGRSMCGVARGEIPTVDVNGEVHACATFADSFQAFPSEFLRSRLDAVRLGPLGGEEFDARYARLDEAIAATSIFDRKELKYSSYGFCGECRFLATCSVCPISIGHIPGNEDPHRVPDFLCAFNLVSLEYRERYQEETSLRNRLLGSAKRPAGLDRILEIAAELDGGR